MPMADSPVRCRPVVKAISSDVLLDNLSAVVGKCDQPAILGGNESVRGWSIFTAQPREVFDFYATGCQPFEQLRAFLSRYRCPEGNVSNVGVPFCGGWIGFFGYELGRFIEKLPCQAVDDIGLPLIRLAFYDKAIVYDHSQRRWYLAALEDSGGERISDKLAILTDWLAQAHQQKDAPFAQPRGKTSPPVDIKSNLTQTDYDRALWQIHRHIRDGDVYQINFSVRFAMPFVGNALDLFRWQNRYNPSPYAAFLAWDDAAVVSASPELFLEVCGQTIRTCPIKGTRKRRADQPPSSPENQAQWQDLWHSAKDQAELAMIVDLERNDLARVCIPGTRSVVCFRRIETFPTVFHAVAEIAGQLALPPTPARVEQVLRATFPGGSITGAPKVRAMEIIDALEPTARSVYTGCIGWISPTFDLCWNIAIRTVIIKQQMAYLQSGGGIVADSQPQAEWQEVLTKAAALTEGIAAVNGATG